MVSEQIDPIAQVAAAILTEDSIGHAEIVVDGTEGTIILKGTVESDQERLIAEALALKQLGVLEVVNRLRIAGL